jgi:hypothetical protein
MLLEDFLATLNVCLGKLRVLGAGDMEQGVTFVCGCDTIDSNDDAIEFGGDRCFVASEWITDNPQLASRADRMSQIDCRSENPSPG